MGQWDKEAGDILFSPWVLRSAWNKVCSWYAKGEWYDPAEFLAWKSDPWRHLAVLAEELKNGTYKPSPFPEVPYPKKGHYTRHYVMPSVRDQVAFMVFLVLLGPFFEARMPNVSFGNRLFRPRVLKAPCDDESAKHKRWFRAPFSLSHAQVYDGFPSSYGLFRRLLQWIVNRSVLGNGTSLGIDELNTEDPDLLPYYDFLNGNSGGFDLVWARLDLRMAYPSVDRTELAKTLTALVQNEVKLQAVETPSHKSEDLTFSRWGRPGFPSLYADSKGFKSWIEPARPFLHEHPWHYLAGDSRFLEEQRKGEELRQRLAEQLAELVNQVQYAPWENPAGWVDSTWSVEPCTRQCPNYCKCKKEVGNEDRYWVGHHGTLPVGCEDILIDNDRCAGLPTGLAISGLLLNVALTPVDETMCCLIEDVQKQGRHLFYLRFVDDMVLLAQNPSDLQMALDTLRYSLARYCGNRLKLNELKAKPPGVRSYLSSNCGKDQLDHGNQRDLGNFLKSSDYLTRENVELFTTSVVREISGLADETLEEMAGAPGIERLEQLMELAALDIDDFEVGDDARLSFAVNKIARASWPKGHVVCDDRILSPEAYVQRILLIAETALRKHPWRFRLWKAIMVIALRASRPFYDKDYGKEWLFKSIIPLIRWPLQKGNEMNHEVFSQRYSLQSWEDMHEDRSFPGPHENCSQEDCKKCPNSYKLYHSRKHRCMERTSFHRSQFWREWATCVRALRHIAENEDATSSFGTWLAYFTPESARTALSWFSKIDEFAREIYLRGEWDSNEEQRFFWWWEAEALVHAALSAGRLTADQIMKLGAPRPGLLRNPEHVGIDYLVEVLGKGLSDRSRKRLEATLKTIMLPKRCNSEKDAPTETVSAELCSTVEDPTEKTKKYPGIWGAIYSLDTTSRTWSRERSSWSKLIPPPGDPELAQFGNMGLWEDFHEILLTYESCIFDKPEFVPTCSELWKRFILFQAYASIRRLLMAHGVRVNWIMFSNWFKTELEKYQIQSGRRVLETTLYKAVYSVSDCSDPLPLPAQVPAVPMNPKLACSLIKAINDTVSVPRASFISPSTVVLPDSEFRRFVDIRKSVLVRGNKRIFTSVPNEWEKPGLVPLEPTHPAPHPLFIFPALFFARPRGENECNHTPGLECFSIKWQKAATLLWMLDGGEHVLDNLLAFVPYQPPLVERDDFRSRFVLPENVWMFIEKALGSNRPEWPNIKDSLEFGEFDSQITPITIDSSGNWTLSPGSDQKGQNNTKLLDELRIRLVQPTATPRWSCWLPSKTRQFFSFGHDSVGKISEEMAHRLLEARNENRLISREAEKQSSHRDMVIMFPEWFAAPNHVPHLKQFCRETGIAVLCGLLPRELPRAVPAIKKVRARGLRCLVNEAVLILPDFQPFSQENRLELPTKVYEFRVRKCCPNVSEISLLMALEQRLQDTHWMFVGGNGWYVFEYPGWGAFTITICSDVLTTGKWRRLAGRIQHLFIPAWNKDIDLFDQVTWTRGYELYANAICANHGVYGGSVVWSPKHGYEKEVFRVHGGNKGIAIVVTVPVRSLVEAKDNQYCDSVREETHKWLGLADPKSKDPGTKGGRFKTPAPRIEEE